MCDELKLRYATPADAAKLLDIYRPYVENTAITFEYDVPSVKEFSERISQTIKKYPYIVAEYNGRIAGYSYAGVFKSRAAYNWDVEVSIYVDSSLRGLGIGKKLYTALESILKEQGFTNVNACITHCDRTNDEHLTDQSEKFHTKMGFSYVGKFHECGFKFGKWYDMIWMEKQIGDHLPNMPEVKTVKEIKFVFQN